MKFYITRYNIRLILKKVKHFVIHVLPQSPLTFDLVTSYRLRGPTNHHIKFKLRPNHFEIKDQKPFKSKGHGDLDLLHSYLINIRGHLVSMKNHRSKFEYSKPKHLAVIDQI